MVPRQGFSRLKTDARELFRVAGMCAGYVVTAIVPQRIDAWFLHTLVGVHHRLRPKKARALAERMAASVRERGREGVPPSRVPKPAHFAEAARMRYLVSLDARMSRIRGLHRRGWKPTVRISGLEHLDEARTQGRGCVLWRMSFCSSTVVKIAMCEAGIPLVHLSQESHGSRSDGWISRRLFCPLYRRTEDPYLAERAIIPWGGSPVGAMRLLLKRLTEENAVASIVGDSPWAQGHDTKLLGVPARFALGAPQLANRVGAALLPVYVVWEDVGTYRVVIEPPIALESGLDQKERLARAVDSFAACMEEAICTYPESWMLWWSLWSSSAPFVRTRSDVH